MTNFQEMMGYTQAELDEAISSNLGFGGHLMMAMSMLSDEQERQALGIANPESTRQALNRVKYVLSKEMERERAAA